MAAAGALHGTAFPISEALKALVFFANGDLGELPPAVCRQLEQAVRAVDEIPAVGRINSDRSSNVPLG